MAFMSQLATLECIQSKSNGQCLNLCSCINSLTLHLDLQCLIAEVLLDLPAGLTKPSMHAVTPSLNNVIHHSMWIAQQFLLSCLCSSSVPSVPPVVQHVGQTWHQIWKAVWQWFRLGVMPRVWCTGAEAALQPPGRHLELWCDPVHPAQRSAALLG